LQENEDVVVLIDAEKFPGSKKVCELQNNLPTLQHLKNACKPGTDKQRRFVLKKPY
jgi:hypothetical protein